MKKISVDSVCEMCGDDAAYAVTITKNGQKYNVFICEDEDCGHFTYVPVSEEE